ncbi:hypothetical protein GCM10009526_31750 [Glutamicibacter creatinolyticus]
MRAVAATDLVIQDYGAPGLDQLGEVAKVVVGHPWTTVEDNQGKGVILWSIRFSDTDPGLVFSEWDS